MNIGNPISREERWGFVFLQVNSSYRYIEPELVKNQKGSSPPLTYFSYSVNRSKQKQAKSGLDPILWEYSQRVALQYLPLVHNSSAFVANCFFKSIIFRIKRFSINTDFRGAVVI